MDEQWRAMLHCSKKIWMNSGAWLTHNTKDTKTQSLSYPSSPLLPSHRIFFSVSW